MTTSRASLSIRDWLQVYTMALIIFGSILVLYQRVTKVETKMDMFIKLYQPPGGYAAGEKEDNANRNPNGRATAAAPARH
jgi:hypothetical protein